ncbi:MAG TPA: EscU/YscU/HrcU family type III secretion system export apparatus switch protein [Planctomycetota bacterium]
MSSSRPADLPRAVALRYDGRGTPAPRVTAKGAGELAERILAIAREHDVPVRTDPDLLELLAAGEVGLEIPEELYRAVAELLAFLQRLNAAEGAPAPGS